MTDTKRTGSPRDWLYEYVLTELQPGDQLPSEQQLVDRLGVSRASIREALESLVGMGMVERRWGIGTFVTAAAHAIAASLNELNPLSETIRGQGRRCEVRQWQPKRYCGPSEAHDLMGLEVPQALWSVSRTYSIDGAPGVYACDHIPASLSGREFDPSLVAEDVLPVLEQEYGVEISHAQTTLDPVIASNCIAQRLRLGSPLPLLRIRQVTYTTDGSALFYTEGFALTEVFSYTILRRRRNF
ncbi:MAG: GntR family transcriptional regulator [Acidimicrobiales bacterium]